MSPLVLIDAPKPDAIAPEAQLVHEYEPESAHTRAGGTGLGLRIARILARSMGGDLLYTDGSLVLTLPIGSRYR